MSDFDDAIGEMAGTLLAEAGSSFVYSRGATSTTITLRKSVQQSIVIDSGTGSVVEVHPVDFIGLTTAMPFDPPVKGDMITNGTNSWELHPTVSDKVYRRLSSQMTRLHAKQVR